MSGSRARNLDRVRLQATRSQRSRTAYQLSIRLTARASIGVPLGWPLPPILVSRTFFEADERE